MKHKIAPSLLAADFLNLQREVEMINESDADWLHLDIMDGVFVPNISFWFSGSGSVEAKFCKKTDGCTSDDRGTAKSSFRKWRLRGALYDECAL